MGEAIDRLVALSGTIHVGGYERMSSTGKRVHVDAYTRSPGKMSNFDLAKEAKNFMFRQDTYQGITAADKNRDNQVMAEINKRRKAGTFGTLDQEIAKGKATGGTFDYAGFVDRNWDHQGEQWKKDLHSGAEMDPGLKKAIEAKVGADNKHPGGSAEDKSTAISFAHAYGQYRKAVSSQAKDAHKAVEKARAEIKALAAKHKWELDLLDQTVTAPDGTIYGLTTGTAKY